MNVCVCVSVYIYIYRYMYRCVYSHEYIERELLEILTSSSY